MSTTAGRKFLDERIELLTTGKFTELTDQYNDGAVLVDFNGIFRGKDALKEHFEQHMPQMGGVELVSIDKFVETDDAVFFEVTVKTGAWGVVTTHEGFVLRDGKADYHFTALK
jgi:SnoaL-like domain